MNTSLLLLAGLALVVSATGASAHSPHEVRHLLEDHGYSKIDFIETSPPIYMANACKEGIRYHFHVNTYGEVTERRAVGECETHRHWPHRPWNRW